MQREQRQQQPKQQQRTPPSTRPQQTTPRPQQQPTQGYTVQAPQQQESLPQRQHQDPQPKSTTQLVTDSSSVVTTLNTVSVELSKGMENAEIYIDILNILLTQHGFANVTIPKHALTMAKNIHYHKNPGVSKVSIPFAIVHGTTPSN